MKFSPILYNTRKIVAICMSGGVDSSVSAYLLQNNMTNHTLIGVHMKNWNTADEKPSNICVESKNDASDAQAVCNKLGISLHHVSFASEYWTYVFEPFVKDFEDGKTPNPDVLCNRYVKFGVMSEYARKNLNANKIATGHYARLWHTNTSIPHFLKNSLTSEENWIESWNNSSILLSGEDVSKDQSYFLSGVRSHSFRDVIFPLGNLLKKSDDRSQMTVRKLASLVNLTTAYKRESMGICFIGKRKFKDFIMNYYSQIPKPGKFIDIDSGKNVANYDQYSPLTVGQGAKISGMSSKYFVVKHKPSTNTFIVCNDTNHTALYTDEFFIRSTDMNWIGGDLPLPIYKTKQMRALCRTRHLQPLVECTIFWDPKEYFYRVHLDTPLRAITPGQIAAIYIANGLVCLGGGTIWNHGPTYYEMRRDLPKKINSS